MTTLKTVRRDALLRKVRAGKMEARCAFSYTDGQPYEEPSSTWKPARICTYGDVKDGFYNLFETDFSSGSGRAYVSGSGWKWDDIVTLHVHSNNIVELREVR